MRTLSFLPSSMHSHFTMTYIVGVHVEFFFDANFYKFITAVFVLLKNFDKISFFALKIILYGVKHIFVNKLFLEYRHIQLDDLDVVATLGVGGFGRVELMQYRHNKDLSFALKYLKKYDMVMQQQQEHAMNEKKIMNMCNSNFICK